MSSVVFVAPYTPPAPQPDPWPGVVMLWEAWDGTLWSLNGNRAEGVRMQAGVEGMTHPDGDHQLDETAGVEGGLWRGWRAAPREVYWPLWVWKEGGSQDWLDYDAAFRRTLDPRRPGRWVVVQPNGTRRYLTCRWKSFGSKAWDVSPGKRAWTPYEVTMLAEQPYWTSDPIQQWFTATSPTPFFGSGAPAFNIASDATISTASMENPGDVDSWLTWWVQNCTSATVGVGGLTIGVPTVASTRMLVIDTNPETTTAIEIDAPAAGLTPEAEAAWVADRLPTGTRRTAELSATSQFGPIPAGESVSLAITMVGSGRVRASHTPHHWGAW